MEKDTDHIQPNTLKEGIVNLKATPYFKPSGMRYIFNGSYEGENDKPLAFTGPRREYSGDYPPKDPENLAFSGLRDYADKAGYDVERLGEHRFSIKRKPTQYDFFQKRKIKVILSDAGGVIFDDSPVRDKFKDFVESMNIDYDLFMRAYKKYSKKAQMDENYGSRDALKDALSAAYIKIIRGKGYSGEVPNYGMYSSLNRSTLRRYKMSILRDLFQEKKKTEGHLPPMGFQPFLNEVQIRLEEYMKQKQEPALEIKKGVRETLFNLKKEGVRYVIMTDSSKRSEYLKERLEKMDLGNLVEDLYSSKDIGARKPDKRFFEYTLSGLREKGIEARVDEILFVGHDPKELEGAHKLGYRTAAIYYLPSDLPKMKNVDYTLKDFSDLLKVVQYENQ